MKPKFEIGDNLAYVIMYIAMIIFFVVISIVSEAQTVSIPTWVADSLIYEAKLSRQCSQVVTAQAEEIKALGKELMQTSKALDLRGSENETLSGLLTNAKSGQEIQAMQFQKDLQSEKRKTKRWRKVAVLETIGLIVGLLILL